MLADERYSGHRVLQNHLAAVQVGRVYVRPETLSVPEMTVLLGGMRALNANTGQCAEAMFTYPWICNSNAVILRPTQKHLSACRAGV